jgi:hypothetical protein
VNDHYGSGAVGPTATFGSFAVLTALLSLTVSIFQYSYHLWNFDFPSFLYPNMCGTLSPHLLYDYYGAGALGRAAAFASFAVRTALGMSLTVSGLILLCSGLFDL